MRYFRHQEITWVTQTPETGLNSSFFLQYTDNKSYVLYSLICLTIFLLVLVLPLNVYILRLIRTGVGTGVASEFFILNLCGCEIIICFSALPITVNFAIYENLSESPLYVLSTFLSSLHTIGRPFFQCCISVERYVAVVHPVLFLKYKPLRYRLAVSAVAWFIVLGFSVSFSFISQTTALYYVVLPEYFVLFTVMVLCSVAVLKTLRKPGPGKKLSAKESESNNRKKKAFWVILIILAFMIVTYGPVMVFICLYDSLSDLQRWNGMLMFSYLLVMAGFVQPFLYLHRVGRLPFIHRI